MSRIFISYSRKDDAFAHRLAQSLTELGADIWIDVKAISAGTKWSRAIQQGLDGCDALLVIVSPDSMASTNVEDEWQYYLEQRKPVIPVLIRPAKMHFQLNRIQYVDFHKQSYDAGLRQLHTELRQHGIKLAAPPPPQQNAQASASASGRGRLGLIVGVVALVALLAGGALLLSRGSAGGDASTMPTQVPSSTIVSVIDAASATPAPAATRTPTDTPATATDAPPTAAATAEPTAAALQLHPIECEGAPPSRLNVGMAGRVSVAEPGELSRAQNVRPEPGTDSEPRVPIPEGTAFEIVGGPECADGFVWWQIETTSAPFVSGWTAEGEITPSGANDYWLENVD